MSFPPSPYQQAIYDFALHGDGSAIVNAVAGSGKTTTLEHLMRIIPPSLPTLMVAFNKAIVVELQSRVKDVKHASVRTMHSMGYGALMWGLRAKKLQLDTKKVYGCFEAYTASDVDEADVEDLWSCVAQVCKLVAMAKGAGLVPGTYRGHARGLVKDTPEQWGALMSRYDIDVPDSFRSMVVQAARHVLSLSLQDTKTIDFDDQLYMPVVLGHKFKQYDWVLVDEAQDLSPIQHEMIRRAVKRGGRVIAVGDRNQSIYGFRGADTESMDKLKAMFNMQELPLSISYRCAKNVVWYAQQLVPHIESHDQADAGQVYSVLKMDAAAFRAVDDDGKLHDLVMCRLTAPLVQFAFDMIRKGIAVNVLGRDIGNGLITLINKLDKREKHARLLFGHEGMGYRLDKYLTRERDKDEELYQRACDKADTIRVLMDRCDGDTVEDLIQVIEALFKGDKVDNRLTLCTVHKAKGLEATRAFVLKPDSMPCPWATQDWEIEQEANLQYVAWTRAKKELVFVDAERIQ